MTAPVIRQFVGTIPDKGQSQTVFDTNVDAWLDWTTLQFAPDLVAFGEFAQTASNALLAGNLPSLTGQSLKAVRVNAAADGIEMQTVTAQGWALLAAADAADQRTALDLPTPVELTQAQAENAASTVFGQVSGQRVAQAVSDNLNASGPAPLYACRAWVNFNGSGTVAIRASGNVSSITDHGTGDYTVNFATALPDANYCAVVTTGNSGTLASANAIVGWAAVYASGSVRIGVSDNNSDINVNATCCNVAIFR